MIEMEGITKAYHLGREQVLALQGVSLKIERGEMHRPLFLSLNADLINKIEI